MIYARFNPADPYNRITLLHLIARVLDRIGGSATGKLFFADELFLVCLPLPGRDARHRNHSLWNVIGTEFVGRKRVPCPTVGTGKFKFLVSQCILEPCIQQGTGRHFICVFTFVTGDFQLSVPFLPEFGTTL
jgi:hypothetical protein